MQFSKYGKYSECWTNSLITVDLEKSLQKVAHTTNCYKWWRFYPGLQHILCCSRILDPAASEFPDVSRHSEQHPDTLRYPTFRTISEPNNQRHSTTFRTTSGPAHQWWTNNSSLSQTFNNQLDTQPRASNAQQQCVTFRYTFGLNLTVTKMFSTYGNIIFDKM